MVKGSKHTKEAIEKLRLSRLGKPGYPHKKGAPISKNASVTCIDCGLLVTNTTVNRRRCKECKKKHDLKRNLNFKRGHTDKVRKENSEYYKRIRATNPERRDALNQRFREWYEKNKEYAREYARECRLENPNYRVKLSQYEKDHPEIRRARESRRRALKLKASGSHTAAEFNALCEMSGWKCSYCGKPLNIKTASRDHKVPLSRGGSDSIDNIAPSCVRCNSRKCAKTIDEFIPLLAMNQ
jgi:5-methylcytosine-specific restriction endonuclease McrA